MCFISDGGCQSLDFNQGLNLLSFCPVPGTVIAIGWIIKIEEKKKSIALHSAVKLFQVL